MRIAKIAHKLIPTVRLCADQNPWGFTPLEMTLLYELRGKNTQSAEVAQRYFADGATAQNRFALTDLINSARYYILSRYLERRRYGPRVEGIWDELENRRIANWREPVFGSEWWEEMLAEQPLIWGYEWLANPDQWKSKREPRRTRVTKAILPPASTKPAVWVDNFDLRALEPSKLPPAYSSEEFDYCADDVPTGDGISFFRADEILILVVRLVEELIRHDRERERVKKPKNSRLPLLRDLISEFLPDAVAERRTLTRQQEPAPKRVEEEAKSSNGHGPSMSDPLLTSRRNGGPRTCPRCRGSMVSERDWYGAYWSCLTCGYVYEAVSNQPTLDVPEEVGERPRQRRRQPSHGKLKL